MNVGWKEVKNSHWINILSVGLTDSVTQHRAHVCMPTQGAKVYKKGHVTYMYVILLRMSSCSLILILSKAISTWACMASMATSPYVDLKASPFMMNFNTGFFSLATNVKHGISTLWNFHREYKGIHGYGIAELNSPVKLFFVRSKIVAFFWLEATTCR